MFRIHWCALLWLCGCLVLSGCDESSDKESSDSLKLETPSMGWMPFSVYDSPRKLTITGFIWYPAENVKPESTVIQTIFPVTGAPYSKSETETVAKPTFRNGRAPVAIFSGRHEGRAEELVWLARFFVDRGYVVLSLDHPQDTHGASTSEGILRVWERPQDITFALNELLQHPLLGDQLDQKRIVGVGYSAGAMTMIFLRGGHYDFSLMKAYCLQAPQDAGCAGFQDVSAVNGLNLSGASASYQDTRFQAMMLLGPVGGAGFSSGTLQSSASIPLLIIAAQNDQQAPLQANAQYYATQIPQSQLNVLSGALSHFIFFSSCNDAGKQLEPSHCIDAVSVNRESIHQTIQQQLGLFLEQHLLVP